MITKTKAVLLTTALFLLASTSSMQISAATIVGWDFTSINSTLGTTGIPLSSVQTNPSPTQTQSLSGGLYGSFKRVSSAVDGLFEINFAGVPTTAFTLTALSMDINSSGAITLGGNFQVQLQHPDVNSGAFTNVGSLIPYGFTADPLTVNFSSDLSGVTSYNNLTGVAVKILFTVFGPNSKTIKIDNLLLTGTPDTGTGLKNNVLQGFSFVGQTIRNYNKSMVQVFDIAGKLVESTDADIDLSQYGKGFYALKSQNGTYKFSVTK